MGWQVGTRWNLIQLNSIEAIKLMNSYLSQTLYLNSIEAITLMNSYFSQTLYFL